MDYRCNACGQPTSTSRGELGREKPSCPGCGSTVRFRAVIEAVTKSLLGYSMTLPEIPERRDLRAVGLSDWYVMAARLAERLNYTNTFYDDEPRLDITHPPRQLLGQLDLVIASDVFEHVPRPIGRAFTGAFDLLKPGGVLVLTVPYSLDADTVEHFPELGTYAIVTLGEQRILVNRTSNGTIEVFENLVFHGGPGFTLEMRLFSLNGLEKAMRDAGFVDIDVLGDAPEFGIIWNEPWGRPLVARRPHPDPVPAAISDDRGREST